MGDSEASWPRHGERRARERRREAPAPDFIAPEVDRLRHAFVAGQRRMEVVVVPRSGEAVQIFFVAQRGVEIDHRVEAAARANPRIDRPTVFIAVGGPVIFRANET